MHRAAARVAGATTAAAVAVWTGDAEHAVNLAGGLHHGHANSAAGFCVYNDIAVAIAELLDRGAKRIAYIDIDAHHGDGVQEIFWNDPRVLTISIHESPRSLFPGTGDPSEIGGPDALGSAVNIALPAGTGDQGFLRAFSAVVPPVVNAFAPEIIICQNGADSHAEDPLTHLTLSVDGQLSAYQAVHRLAHAHGGKLVSVGGGGYDLFNAVPRSWAHLIAVMAGKPVAKSTPVPDSFIEYVRALTGSAITPVMTDGAEPWAKPIEQGFNPKNPVDEAIMQTRLAVFPYYEIDPEVNSWF
jgi:acetoin utilization protein AcuC